MISSRKTLWSISLIFLFLASEVLSLRFLFKWGLKANIGWQAMTDYDLAIPFTVAFFICFWLLSQKEPLRVRKHRGWMSFHGMWLASFVAFTALTQNELPLPGSWQRSIWFLGLGGTFLTGLFCWISPRFIFQNPSRWAVVPCVLLGFSVVLYQHFFDLLWPSFGYLTGKVVCQLLPHIALGNSACEMLPDQHLLLRAKFYRAQLAPGCVGLDGQFFNGIIFLLFSLFWTPLGKDFKRFQTFLLLGLGSLGIFFLNILRILILFRLGQWSMTTDSYEALLNTVAFIFHSHLGWVLYGTYLWGLYRALVPHLIATSREHGPSSLLKPLNQAG